MASATAYERRMAKGVYCEFCCAAPGEGCAAYSGLPSRMFRPPARTHMQRVKDWRKRCEKVRHG